MGQQNENIQLKNQLTQCNHRVAVPEHIEHANAIRSERDQHLAGKTWVISEIPHLYCKKYSGRDPTSESIAQGPLRDNLKFETQRHSDCKYVFLLYCRKPFNRKPTAKIQKIQRNLSNNITLRRDAVKFTTDDELT